MFKKNGGAVKACYFLFGRASGVAAAAVLLYTASCCKKTTAGFSLLSVTQ